MFKFLLFFLLLILNNVSAQTSSDSLIVGVGYGVFVIGFGIVVAVIICLIGRATRYPEFFFLFSLIIPVFLILFFSLAPKEAQRAKNEQEQFQTDDYLIPRYIYLVIFIITFCLTSCCVCNIRYFGSLMAQRVGTVYQEGSSKDGFFDHEAPKVEDEEKDKINNNNNNENNNNNSNLNQNAPLEQMKSRELGASEFNARSENVSAVGKKQGIIKRKQKEPFEIEGNK